MTTPDPQLQRAFWSTSYGTARERGWLARQPGLPPGWATGRWGIVTAWNPQGWQADRVTNQERQAALEQQLQKRGLTFLPGHNGEGEWQEPTCLIASISAEELAALGTAFGQAAVLHGTGPGGQATLLWLDKGGVYCREAGWAVRQRPD
ncbi:DUF3293 domain-containing protein [Deinococcus sp. Marseille-Q6407]|uniref:DUF3293 domain-containing protein n=1 Tax=Deinococcus sp. Marseille-Q6407 TaxID=2969223 RepID=UPI0021C147EA|nr:DUF3293 domain-containing protein [Deinococcus sp. Marseille-Q6407]